MKKLIIIILVSCNIMICKEVSVGPAETKNIPKICKKACKKEHLNWTGKTTCEFLRLTDDHNCRCECKNGNMKNAKV